MILKDKKELSEKVDSFNYRNNSLQNKNYKFAYIKNKNAI